MGQITICVCCIMWPDTQRPRDQIHLHLMRRIYVYSSVVLPLTGRDAKAMAYMVLKPRISSRAAESLWNYSSVRINDRGGDTAPKTLRVYTYHGRKSLNEEP